jgi:hypothetical protein
MRDDGLQLSATTLSCLRMTLRITEKTVREAASPTASTTSTTLFIASSSRLHPSLSSYLLYVAFLPLYDLSPGYFPRLRSTLFPWAGPHPSACIHTIHFQTAGFIVIRKFLNEEHLQLWRDVIDKVRYRALAPRPNTLTHTLAIAHPSSRPRFARLWLTAETAASTTALKITPTKTKTFTATYASD